MASSAALAPFNLAHYLIDARIEEGLGARTAIVAGDQRLTYADVQDQANRVANVLRALGIAAGDRVLIALSDGPEFVAALLGTLKAGAVVTMVNPALPAADYAGYLQYTRARLLFADAALAARAQDVITSAPGLCATVVVGGSYPVGRLFVRYDERVAAASLRFANAPTRADDVAIWLFTSGATGTPRAAVHRHSDFVYNIERYAKRILEIAPSDVVLSVPRLFFGYGTGMSLMFPLAVGATAVLAGERPSPEQVLALCSRHRPTILANVPTMIAKMVDLAATHAGAREALASVRVMLSAGEALPADLYQRWKAAFGVEIMEGLGSVEMFHIFISNRMGDIRPGCLGRLVPGYEARVVLPDGGDAPEGELGTLWVRGGSAAVRYEDDPERTAHTMRDGWIVSSDLVRCDGGVFSYQGRSDDMLKVGGIYVSPLEVENVLLQHPAVAECAVVGYQDPQGLTKPKAYVVPRSTAAAHVGAGDGTDDAALWSALEEFARARLAAYKLPRLWERRDALPRNDRGKILRRELR